MKKWLSGCLFITLALSGQEGQQNQQKELTYSNAAFGWKLYEDLKGSEGNICFSPYSISSCLAMAYAGAKGETAKIMKEVLQYKEDVPVLLTSIANLNHFLTSHPSNYSDNFKILLANSMWVQERFKIDNKFAVEMRKLLSASPNRVDFAGQSETARAKINRWVASNTNNKITELFPRGSISASTRMVLASALFLKALWMVPFQKSATHYEPFFSSAKKTKTLPMMHLSNSFLFLEAENELVIELPLQKPEEGPALSMVFVLPKEREGLHEVEEGLSIGKLEGWFKEMEMASVNVTLPKFTIREQLSLKDSFANLGMENPFQPEADFSGITGSKDLYISDVVHETYLDVTEGGVEAAAATGAIMNLTAVLPGGVPKTFKADHPFFFLLRDKESGVVLFLGRFIGV